MKSYRVLCVALLAAILGALVVAPGRATATTSPFVNFAVTGTLEEGGTFVGTATVTRFTARNGQVKAVARLSGTLYDADGNTIGTVTNVRVRFTVTFDEATCDVLRMTLAADVTLLARLTHLTANLEILADAVVRATLCEMADAIAHGEPAAVIADLLNTLKSLYG